MKPRRKDDPAGRWWVSETGELLRVLTEEEGRTYDVGAWYIAVATGALERVCDACEAFAIVGARR